MDFSHILTSFKNFMPEIILAGFFCVALLIDAFAPRGVSRRIVGGWAMAGILVAGFLSWAQTDTTANEFMGNWFFHAQRQPEGTGMLVVDNFAIFFKLLVCVAALLVTVFSLLSQELEQEAKPRLGEYFSLLLAMTFGMFLMAGANDLLLMYMAIEIVSLSSYAITGFTKNVPRSGEAAMKYVIYGGVSSGVMLFGISMVYGMTGTTNFAEIMTALSNPAIAMGMATPLTIACLMMLAGLGYKISAAPFHAWTPDVYEGAPITITAFLSVASKAAGFALLVRFVVTAFPPAAFDWRPIIAAVSVFTMTLGNLAALQQSNLKRLLAYSSIAHAGYMLMGLAVATGSGISAILLYFAIYLVMNLGGFFAIQKIAEKIGSEELDDYRGLGPRIPLVGVLLGVFMISLVGLPPTAGFVGKFFLFSALLKGGSTYLWLAVVGVVNSVISLYYYVRVLKVMYLDKPLNQEASAPIKIDNGSVAIMGVLAAATLLLGLPNFFGPLVNIAQGSLGSMARMLMENAPSIGHLVK